MLYYTIHRHKSLYLKYKILTKNIRLPQGVAVNFAFMQLQNSGDDTSDEKEVVNVPIEKKLNLTIREAAEYSNIGMNKINEMLRNPMCSFVLYVGTKNW